MPRNKQAKPTKRGPEPKPLPQAEEPVVVDAVVDECELSSAEEQPTKRPKASLAELAHITAASWQDPFFPIVEVLFACDSPTQIENAHEYVFQRRTYSDAVPQGTAGQTSSGVLELQIEGQTVVRSI